MAAFFVLFIYLGPKVEWSKILSNALLWPPVLLLVAVIGLYQRIPLVPKAQWMLVDNALWALRRQLRGAAPKIVATHDTGHVCFLICKTDAEARELGARRDELFERFRQQLERRGVDSDARALSYVSREEIERGGGSFHYWRERGRW